MDGPRDYHTKWSQAEKDKYYIISSLYVASEKNTNNLFTKQKQTHKHVKQTYGYQKGKGRRKDKLGV